MITAIVQFRLPKPVSRDKAQELFLGTAPKYREAPGLVRKYYLLSDDGSTAGGAYLWKSRSDAERMYTPEWRQFIVRTYGAEPRVQYFETPVVVDNVVGDIART
jgi:putative monooxygenase ydhR